MAELFLAQDSRVLFRNPISRESDSKTATRLQARNLLLVQARNLLLVRVMSDRMRDSSKLRAVPIGTVLNLRTTTSQNCEAVPRRARI